MKALRHQAMAVGVTLALTTTAGMAEESPTSSDDDRTDMGGKLDATKLSKPPSLLKGAIPEYPRAALGHTAEVEITLLLELAESGDVTSATVIEPATPTGLGFEEAALLAAYELQFTPAELDGKPVAVQVTYKLHFIPPKPVAESRVPAPAPDAGPAPAATREPTENFEGTLRERGTRLPMAGILVTVYRTEGDAQVGFEALSDRDGHFAFFDLAPGDWQIAVEPPGYYPFRTTEEIRKGERTHATYHVEKGSYNPFDVTVTEQKPRKEVSRTIIDNAIIEKTPGAMGDPLAVIQNYAGVARVQGMLSDIVVRGSAPHDTRIFVDGIEVPLAFHFLGIRSVLPLGMIENLEFYPGNFGPSYGRATGGVIDVTLKKLKPKKTNGYLDLNLLDGSLYVEAPLSDKLAVALSGRRSYMDLILNAVIPDDAPIKMVTAPVYYDYQVLVSYRPTAAHDLRLFAFGSDDRFKMLFQQPTLGTEVSGNNLSLATTFNRLVLTHRYVPSIGFENLLRVSQGRDAIDFQIAQYFEDLRLDLTHIRDHARLEVSDGLALVAGADLQRQRWSGAFRSPLPPQEGQAEENVSMLIAPEAKVGETRWLAGVYGEIEWKPHARLLLVPGIRYDHFSITHANRVAPRFTARLSVNQRLTLKGGAGFYYQEPTLDQSFKDLGNPNLEPERAIHYSAGAEWKPLGFLSFDITGFYKALDNLVSPTSATTIEDGQTFPLRYDNNGRGRVYGMELVIRHDLNKRFTGWLAYTLSRSQRLDSGAGHWRLFQYDQPHILTAVGMVQLPHNWQLSSRFRLVSGSPTTPVIGSVYNATSDEYHPTMGATYTSRDAAFMQLDLRLDKRWIFDGWMLNAYLDIQNITNRDNPEGIQYSFDYSERTVRQGMPIYPLLGLKGEF